MSKRLTRGQAIRKYCLECCCESPSEVRRCPTKNCPLFAFRLGHEDKNIEEDEHTDFS